MKLSDPVFTKRFSSVFCLILSVAVLAVPVLYLALPSSDYSPEENRMLATMPSMSPDTLLSGQYPQGLSDYLRDRLPFRSTLLRVKSTAEYAALKRENNHVIMADHAYWVKRFSYTKDQQTMLQQNATALDRLAEALRGDQAPSVFVCAPRAIDVLQDFCPTNSTEPYEIWPAIPSPYGKAITSLLRQKANAGESVWFRTDHHWTPLGAYYAYSVLGAALGYTPYPKEAFFETEVSHTFLGTAHSAGLAPFCRPDRIVVFRYEGDDSLVCTDMSTGESHMGLYCESALSQKDQYEYFLGKNTAHLRIQKDPHAPRPTLLLIKDSYAQSLAPFLARHFDIEMLDPRYFRTDMTPTLHDILSSPHYAGSLILCNADTLTEDIGLDRIRPENL